MTVRYFVGRIDHDEELKYVDNNAHRAPSKKDFVLLPDDFETYRVVYRTYIPAEDIYEVFLKYATDEDY